MSDKSHEAKIENVGATQKPSFGQRLLAHYKKWWWAHLIFLIASVLIITLCLVYVGFPNIAQHDVNDSTLRIKSQEVSNPTPDSVDLHIESISDSDSMYHPELDPFNASLALATGDSSDSAKKPFGYITIPGLIAGTDVPVTVEQTLQITDMDAFVEYNIAVLKEESFNMLVSGDVTLHEMTLPATTSDYDKIVTMKGLNGLKGFNISDLDIKLSTSKERNVEGKVYIPNPSVLTIHMGTAYLDMYLEGKNVGYSVLENLTLKPGDNWIDMWGHTNVGIVTQKLIHYQKDNFMVPFTIKGNRTIYDGKEIPYYSAAIQSNTLTTTLDLGKILGGI